MNEASAARPVPDAPGHWLFGLGRELAQAPHTMPAELGRRHGGVARFRLLHRPFLAVTDPALARQILHSDDFERSYHYETYQSLLGQGLIGTEGAGWARHRRMILPAFRTGHLNRFTRVMRDCTMATLERWEALRRSGQPIDAVEEGHRITLAVMGKSLMSAPVDTAAADRFAAAVDRTLMLVRLRNTSILRLPLWFPSPVNRQLRSTRTDLDSFVGAYVAERLPMAENDRRDLLDDLRAARSADTNEAMTYTELLEETKTLFVTGYETTSVSLAWALHLLSAHPAVAARWHEEVDRVLADGEIPERLRTEDFPYTTALVNETMRLYPAVYNVGRVARVDTRIGDYRISKGDTALVSIYGLHRDPEIWEDPESFRPERFLNGIPNRDAFLPFASGGHLCVGANFAMLEMVTVLAIIGQRYRLAARDPSPPGMVARITLAPTRALEIDLEPRK